MTDTLYAQHGIGYVQIIEIDEFTGGTRIVGSGQTEAEAWEDYEKSLPQSSCDLENPHLCESCQ